MTVSFCPFIMSLSKSCLSSAINAQGFNRKKYRPAAIYKMKFKVEHMVEHKFIAKVEFYRVKIKKIPLLNKAE